MSGSNRCDCCCACGAFCSNAPYCGCDMLWVSTYSGAVDGGASSCGGSCPTDINVSLSFTYFDGCVNAADWNASRPAWTSHDAKAGSKVCRWLTTGATFGTQVDFCSNAGYIRDHAITVYIGTDNKWRMVFAASIGGAYFADVGGEAEFDSSGSPMDCGTPGEGSPTFSLTIPLTLYLYVGSTSSTCDPPTSVLVEGDPQ